MSGDGAGSLEKWLRAACRPLREEVRGVEIVRRPRGLGVHPRGEEPDTVVRDASSNEVSARRRESPIVLRPATMRARHPRGRECGRARRLAGREVVAVKPLRLRRPGRSWVGDALHVLVRQRAADRAGEAIDVSRQRVERRLQLFEEVLPQLGHAAVVDTARAEEQRLDQRAAIARRRVVDQLVQRARSSSRGLGSPEGIGNVRRRSTNVG